MQVQIILTDVVEGVRTIQDHLALKAVKVEIVQRDEKFLDTVPLQKNLAKREPGATTSMINIKEI
jgi:hypothetical protein